MLNIAIIGMGQRGKATLKRLEYIPQANITMLCDNNPEKVSGCTSETGKYGTTILTANWQDVTGADNVDLVYICTPWDNHVQIAVEAMKAGKHVAIEVPAAMNVEHCELLVRIARWTNRHCVMLENCCYDTWHLGIKEIVRSGALGNITHLEGAYIHPVDNEWMKDQRIQHKGNPYPTHGFGPMCQLLPANDKPASLISMSTTNGHDNTCINDTLIKTKKGVIMLLQYDTSTPRPYNRLQTVCGTTGFAQKYPLPTLYIYNGENQAENLSLTGDEAVRYVEEHIAPEFKMLIEEGRRLGVENVMNYMMDRRLIDGLLIEKDAAEGDDGNSQQMLVTLDTDVQEAALWSCITELTEMSATQDGACVHIPEF